MRIHETGHHVVAGGVEIQTGNRARGIADRDHPTALDADVGLHRALGVDHEPSPDDDVQHYARWATRSVIPVMNIRPPSGANGVASTS